ncbi:DUF6622 family protein [Niveibacterium sp. SC-1]|uniref:DUF6622 family protein n=1 Tax=Niveibacterium sp. SC-1 TaxID=3135646 RepID=UPI00311E773C
MLARPEDTALTPTKERAMFIEILKHIPLWVFGVFFVLLYMGLKQVRPREVSVKRLVLVPLLMMAWSLAGMLGSFAHHETLAGTAWASGFALVLGAAALRGPAIGVRYDAARRVLQLPGSWTPLALMMGIFWLKFGVGMATAMQPSLADLNGFAAPVCLAYGALSGVFAGRALRLLRATRREAGWVAA